MAKRQTKPTMIDKSIHIENCQLSNVDEDRMQAVSDLARAAQANATAILEIARSISAGGAIGMKISQIPD
jgi:hypothetical protein